MDQIMSGGTMWSMSLLGLLVIIVLALSSLAKR
jgi:hypothetical protein